MTDERQLVTLNSPSKAGKADVRRLRVLLTAYASLIECGSEVPTVTRTPKSLNTQGVTYLHAALRPGPRILFDDRLAATGLLESLGFTRGKGVRLPSCHPLPHTMKFHVHLLWKVLVPLDRANAVALHSNLFNLAGGKSFARRLGGDFRLESIPAVLSPTDLFHSGLKPTRVLLGLEGSRFPYLFGSETQAERRSVNIAIHLHDGALCLTVRLAPFYVSSPTSWPTLQDLRQHKVLWNLTKKVLATSVTGDLSTRFGREPQVLPALHIRALEQDLQAWPSQLVSIVTRHENVNENVVNDVVAKNRPHRVDQTLLLVDKQGIAAYVPLQTSSAAVVANLDRFEHAAAMLQLAAALRLELRSDLEVTSDAASAILDPNAAVTASISGRRIWSLLVQEFSLATSLRSRSAMNLTNKASTQVTPVPMPSTSSSVVPLRILLITVTVVESRALKAAITAATGRSSAVRRIDGFTYQDYGRLGDYELMHQISGMGSGGVAGSQESARRGIHAVKPNAILMIGIAFGVDRTKQPVGTILVSKQIQTYELQRVNPDASITPRGDIVTASPRLLDWVSHAEIDLPESFPRIKKGLMLSGEKLIDNQDYRDQLLKVAPEAIGGEMEGAGLYVASQNAQVDWLLVKAVCDWADGNKAVDKDQLQASAARSAAEFCVHILRANSTSTGTP